MSKEERLELVREGREDRGKYQARAAVKQKKVILFVFVFKLCWDHLYVTFWNPGVWIGNQFINFLHKFGLNLRISR